MDNEFVLLPGDCLEVLKTLPDNSLDSMITDPPAGISFMGKEWDEDKGGSREWIAWMTSVMKEALRVLKPGAHGLVWAIPRTSHWTATALEDAGFEIRDVVTHLFGSGFPKSLDISKAIDKAAGAEREQGKLKFKGGSQLGVINDDSWKPQDVYESTPSTSDAKRWQGFGTALKPASEHWILARKPLSEKTVAANVLAHGTGGINIDASRVGTEQRFNAAAGSLGNGVNMDGGRANPDHPGTTTTGRFPANLVLSHNEDCVQVGQKKVGSKSKPLQSDNRVENNNQVYGKGLGVHTPENSYADETVDAWECTERCAIAELDRQSGVSKSVAGSPDNKYATSQHNDSGGASRFFYCAKASKSEKNAGLDTPSTHPTVKSLKLMSYLINLITPPGGIVLDPFTGSGSTGCAALKDGFSFIGIEKEPEYIEIAEKRLEYHHKAKKKEEVA